MSQSTLHNANFSMADSRGYYW